ncbi:hypothetical protein JCGZ_02777 [Jatropha curcas]|uniref:Uncharacterized protein n=1 Tax=Jatropha curcas TaxID=180498 RepID=A0A067KUG9_JATCU|nr:hypothetical protein JCGZ_02777 [Jatropha curcas]
MKCAILAALGGCPLDGERRKVMRHTGGFNRRHFDQPVPIAAFDDRRIARYSHTTSDVGVFRQLLNGLNWDRIEGYPWGDVVDFFDFIQAFIGYKHRRLFLSRLFYGAYTVFAWTQFLIHGPPPTEFDAFTEEEELDQGQGAIPVQRGKRVRRGSGPKAPNMAVIIGTPEHGPSVSFSFILDYTGQPAEGMLEMHLVSPYRMSPPGCTHVFIDDYNEVCQLYEVGCLKLAEARLSDEHIFLKIPTVPRLDVDPASLILPVFSFSAYEILSYDFRADIVPLRPLVNRAMSMDRTSPFWPSLICFCLLSQYLLLSGIDGYGSFRLDSSSVLGLMGSPLLLQLWAFEKLQTMSLCPSSMSFDWRDCGRLDYYVSESHLRGNQMAWWYIERVTISSYMLCVPLCGLSIVLAYYPSCVARQYGHHQAIPNYTWFEGGLLTQ